MQTKQKMKLKTGDLVAVIAGKDKGKTGKITEVIAKHNKVVVEGMNQVKRHQKASQLNPQGGITVKTLPIHASNVMIVDPKTGKPSRIGKKAAKDGSFTRIAKKSGTELPAASATAK